MNAPRPLRLAGLAVALAVVIVAVFPWGDFQNHTHWAKVAWIPFVSPPVRLSDIAQNLLLFAPLGAMVALNVRTRELPAAVAVAFVLSFAGESAQLFSHTRFPSATDLVCNVAGACYGAWVVRLRRTRGGFHD